MKKQLIKGILAATLAFVTVVGVPVGAAKTAKSDNTIIAYAKCNHNCRHYGSSSGWTTSYSYWTTSGNTDVFVVRQYNKNYSVCVNCGHKELLSTKYRLCYTYYYQSGAVTVNVYL